MRYAHFRHGFTIVELLFVIVIIAILAAITIVAYNGAQDHAHAASLASGLRSLKLYVTAQDFS